MANFIEAQNIVAGNEGGYALVKGDKGGETYCGISRVFYPEWHGWKLLDLKPHPIRWNTIFTDQQLKDLVDNFYEQVKWPEIKGDEIKDQNVANYFYDWHVNSGGAIKQVQKILGVTPDGIFGNFSLSKLNSGDYLLKIHEARVTYYNRIGVNGNAQFLSQWLERANKVYALCTTQQH